MTTREDGKVICWMCGGWTCIHPLDTGETIRIGKSSDTKPLVVWAASRAQHQPGDMECPACEGSGFTEPVFSKYPGDFLPLSSRIW